MKKSPGLIGTRGRIRTLNPRSRNPIFYPVELRAHETDLEMVISKSVTNINYFYAFLSTSCTFSAASFKVMAEATFNPDSSMILAPSSALVP